MCPDIMSSVQEVKIMVLDQRKRDAINLLADGKLQKKQICEKLGIPRSTLYFWLETNQEFVSALDSAVRQIRELGDKLLAAKLDDAVNEYWELRKTTTNENVKSDIYKYFIDRNLGKPTSKHEIEATATQPKVIDVDELEKELDKWDEELDENKETSSN